jgi:hypothetical protein
MREVRRNSGRRRVRHSRKDEQWRPTNLQTSALVHIHNVPRGRHTSSSVCAHVTRIGSPFEVSRANPDETVTLFRSFSRATWAIR